MDVFPGLHGTVILTENKVQNKTKDGGKHHKKDPGHGCFLHSLVPKDHITECKAQKHRQEYNNYVLDTAHAITQR